MTKIRAAWALGLLIATLAGCDNAEEQTKLDQAKSAASAKAAAEEAEANKQEAAARERRIADAKAEPARSAARASIRKTLTGFDMKAQDLKEKLAKAKAKAKPSAALASAEYDARRTAAERDVEGLNTETGPAWDTLKSQTDKDLDSVKAALDAFDKAVAH